LKIALIVNPLIPVPPEQYGGIERIVFMLIQYLINKGHQVTLYANEYSQPGCKLIGYHESENYNFVDFLKINKLTVCLLFKGFDVVHTFGRMSNIALLMPAKIPKVVSYQLSPTVSQVKKAIIIARKNSLHFTACSNYIANQIKAYTTVTTIYNGVDTNQYQYNDLPATDAPLVFLGRIQKEKGTDIAIKVAKKTGKKLIIAGNIPNEAIHRQYFNEQIKPFIDDEQVTYVGPVNNYQKNTLLKNALAFLMPVTWDEPFGIVMAEALACGTPIIGFGRGAVPEVVVDGLNGFVCQTLHEMIDAVNKVNTISREKCRLIAEEKFSADVIGQQYEKLYRQLTGK
jgi:glycosyltransferase involved in cell wall biosynthesis